MKFRRMYCCSFQSRKEKLTARTDFRMHHRLRDASLLSFEQLLSREKNAKRTRVRKFTSPARLQNTRLHTDEAHAFPTIASHFAWIRRALPFARREEKKPPTAMRLRRSHASSNETGIQLVSERHRPFERQHADCHVRFATRLARDQHYGATYLKEKPYKCKFPERESCFDDIVDLSHPRKLHTHSFFSRYTVR